MNVTSSASGVYSQYQNLIDRLKTGSVSYQDALTEHRELFPETRGLTTAVVRRVMDFAPTQNPVPVEVIERFQATLDGAAHDR
jgi:hypothetical protein